MAMTRLEKKAKDERRRLSAGATELEDALWRGIARMRPGGEPFQRQVVLGPYLADFVSHAARLVVEIDGAQHGFPEQRTKDASRDAWLKAHGYRVLRFANAAVRSDAAAVLDTIRAVVEERRQRLPDKAPIPANPVSGKRRPRPG